MQLDSMIHGLKRSDLAEFVKLKISEYGEKFLKVRINNFTVDDLSQQMNWSLNVAARFKIAPITRRWSFDARVREVLDL
jgi:hypothetical protein